MIRLALLLALLLTTAAAAQQKEFSLPPLAEDVAATLQAVGRVNKAGFNVKGNCTGTLVRPDVVLTAGHCAGGVIGTGSNRMFVAGWSRGDYIAARRIAEVRHHPAYGLGERHDPRFDVGLLFLESPITEVAPIAIAKHSAQDVAIAGYHRFIPHLLTGRLDCPVVTEDQYLIRIDCPVVSGNSGGPVLEPDGAGGWHVTAVVSSQETLPDRLRTIAVLVPQWVHDVLAEHEASR